MRGNRLSARGLGGERAWSAEGSRGVAAASQLLDYWCAQGHQTQIRFASDADVPAQWPCVHCNAPGGLDRLTPPELPPAPPPNGGRTPWEYLMMRRSPEDGERLLEEALARLRGH